MKDKRMSKKEADMVYIFECIVNKEISQTKAAQILCLSTRHIRRKLRRYEKEGSLSLAHANRGKLSNRRTAGETIALIMSLLETRYSGYGPTLAAEKLAKYHAIPIDHETLRRLMIQHGLWQKKERRVVEHVWRERKHHFGELVQIDGSYHKWFNDTYSTLIAFIDDATSVVELFFADFETTESLAIITQSYLAKHGRPRSLYADCGKVYKVNNAKDQDHHETQFVRMLGELDIKMIHAYSPQAKGRVERLFKTVQDRLVKDLALHNIKTMEEANAYLRNVFMAEINELISIQAKNELDLHRSLDGFDLKTIFCHKETRKLNKDRTISYYGRWFLIKKEQPVRLYAGSVITVCRDFDGTISLMLGNKRLDYKEIEKPLKQAKPKENELFKVDGREHNGQKPPRNHPWRSGGKYDVPKSPKADISTELKTGHF